MLNTNKSTCWGISLFGSLWGQKKGRPEEWAYHYERHSYNRWMQCDWNITKNTSKNVVQILRIVACRLIVSEPFGNDRTRVPRHLLTLG